MDVSKIAHLFQQNNMLYANNSISKCNRFSQQADTTSDMIKKISNQIITPKQGSADAESAKETQTIKMDTYTKTDSSQSLEEMPREVLEYYMGVTKLFANSSSSQEQDLLAFKERLQGMDQTIQGYQDILDGKAALPKELKTEDVIHSITEAKQMREQFVKDGVEHLNKWSSYFITSDIFDNLMQKVLGENKFAGQDGSNWMLDVSAADLYTEIDRVLTETQSVTAELERGIKRIYNVLKDRGFGDEYQHFLKSWHSELGSYFDQIEAKDVQQLMLDNLMQMPLQEVKSSG